MAFKNVGTYNLDKAVSGSAGAANAGAFTMDAAGIASGQAFLTAELEKRDTLVRLAAAGQSLFPRCRWVTASLEAPGIT